MSNPGWDRQTLPPPGASHLWLQWKGSAICADFYCSCETHWHLDNATFLYYVRCPACALVYLVNGHVELVPLTPNEAEEAARRGPINEPLTEPDPEAWA